MIPHGGGLSHYNSTSLAAYFCDGVLDASHAADTMRVLNPLMPELNPSTQRCLMRYFTGDFAYGTMHFVHA
jgi:hypothetical protein